MEPIQILPVPTQAFNKNRRISDLILAQIRHLKHLEEKLPVQARLQIPQHPIVTEDDAARYIAPMTRLLRTQGTASAPPASSAIPRPIPIRSSPALDIAATADGKKSAGDGRRSAAGKSPSKSKTATPARKEKKR